MNKSAKRRLVFLGPGIFLLLVIALARFWEHRSQARWKLPTGNRSPVLSVGVNHAVILAADGTLWTWGESAFGWQVLGLGGNMRTQACLRRLGSETNWVSVAVGGSTTLALKSDGTLWGWGENISGQLGNGSSVRDQPTPIPAALGNDWKQVAEAGPHTLALKRDGTLWSWGNNWAGQLGTGSTNHSRVPVRVGSSTNWTRIWANLIQNVAQQADGSLWFWGWDYSRSKAGMSIPIPTRVSPDTNWVSVGMGDWLVFAIKTDGTLWAWGRMANTYTGVSTAGANSAPVQVGTNTDWRECSYFAGSKPLFMKRDGSIWVLDASDHRGVAPVTGIVKGLLENNQLNFLADSDNLGGDPAFGVLKVLEITYQMGATNGVAIFTENKLVKLGDGRQPLTITHALYGDPALIGRATNAWNQAQPAQFRQLALPTNVVAFAGGRHGFGAALTSDGEVWTWGESMGRHTLALPPLQGLSRFLGHFGMQVHWGEPQPVILNQPERLERQ